MALKKARFETHQVSLNVVHLLGGGVFGDSLGSFGNGVFGQFSGQQEPDSGLDFPGGDGGSLVVVSQTRSLSSNPFKNVIDKGVHDAHGL